MNTINQGASSGEDRGTLLPVCVALRSQNDLRHEAADTIEELYEALEEARTTLNAIASWRADSAAYTDRLDLPQRKMDEAQVIHIETEAKGPLRIIDAALAKATGQ